MAISSFRRLASNSGGAAGDFIIEVTSLENNTFELNSVQPKGFYKIELQSVDNSYDIYLVDSSGNSVGYSNSDTIEATEDFSSVVAIGFNQNQKIYFEYDGEISVKSVNDNSAVVGPVLRSVSPSSMPNVDDTITISGNHFTENTTITFTSSGYSSLAKNVTFNSSKEIVVTRPDNLPVSLAPFSVIAENPGQNSPVGSGANILSNAVSAGTGPVWQTDGDLVYNLGSQTPDITLLAADTEDSVIDYSIASGSLPPGLNLNSETGVISGTFSGSAVEGDVTTVTFRALDQGGNFLDKQFDFVANGDPVWTTPAGEISSQPGFNSVYSFQLEASTGSQGGTLTYTLESGSLHNGLTLSSTGLISGTNTDADGVSVSFVVRATDQLGLFSERSFTSTVAPLVQGGTETVDGAYTFRTFTSSENLILADSLTVDYMIVAGGGGSTHRGGGGGAGGMITGNTTLSPGTYPVVIGTGTVYASGGDSSFAGITCTGGGRGSSYSGNNSLSGGSGGGGGNGSGAPGISGQGNSGGSATYGSVAGGGGGKGASGQNGSQYVGGKGGAGQLWLDGQYYAAGGGAGNGYNNSSSDGGSGIGGGSNHTVQSTGSGGGGPSINNVSAAPWQTGADGIVKIRYATI